jgi:hypothetical protein
VIYTLTLTTVLLGSAIATGAYVTARGHDRAESVTTSDATDASGGAGDTVASGSPDAGTAESVVVQVSREPEVDWDGVLSDALEDVSGGEDARYSVAVRDADSGDSAVYGDGSFDTASIVKVDILATLLLQAQDDGRHLTAQQKAYAKVMIENSDNTAATALWRSIGRGDGLDAANKRFGMTRTEAGSGLLWGLTRTTAADQLKLLRTVFADGDDAVLNEASRAYVQSLMGQVSAAQDWGVPSAADDTDYEVKNGWLQRSTTGLWDINSVGRVRSGGRTYLVAVLSNGSVTQAKGIGLVEEAAQAAVTAFTEAAASPSPSES